MDPVTLIVTALVSGAAAGLKDTAGEALKDAYSALKGLLKRKFAGKPGAEMALEQYAEKPEVWEALLREEIQESGADRDEEVLHAAQGVLQITNPQQSAEGKYVVQITGPAQGNVFGDGATVNQTFGAPPDR